MSINHLMHYQEVSGPQNRFFWSAYATSAPLQLSGVTLAFDGDICTGMRVCTNALSGKMSAQVFSALEHHVLLSALPKPTDWRPDPGFPYTLVRLDYDKAVFAGGLPAFASEPS